VQYGVIYYGDSLHTPARDSVIVDVLSARVFPRLVVDHNPALPGQSVICRAILDTVITGGEVTFFRDERQGR